MKKTYIIPEMEIVNMEVKQMLTTSVTLGSGTTTDQWSREVGDDDWDW